MSQEQLLHPKEKKRRMRREAERDIEKKIEKNIESFVDIANACPSNIIYIYIL